MDFFPFDLLINMTSDLNTAKECTRKKNIKTPNYQIKTYFTGATIKKDRHISSHRVIIISRRLE